MNEEVVTFGSTRTLVGILHHPRQATPQADRPAVLLLNAGILHRVGPNRLYVTMARQLADLGFTVLRFDVWGIGDSQEHADGVSENKTFVDDTLEAFEFLQRRVGARRFMLMGICMGAQIALAVADRDRRVESLVLMEGIYVKSARYHLARMLDPKKWRRVVTGESHLLKQVRSRLARRLDRLLKGASAAPAPKDPGPTAKGSLVLFLDANRERNMKETLAALLARGTRVLLVFRDGNEIAYNYQLRRSGDSMFAVGLPEGLEVTFVPFADHTFTPLVSQQLLLQTTLSWIEEVHHLQRATA